MIARVADNGNNKRVLLNQAEFQTCSHPESKIQPWLEEFSTPKLADKSLPKIQTAMTKADAHFLKSSSSKA